jgi:hypothetical protein
VAVGIRDGVVQLVSISGGVGRSCAPVGDVSAQEHERLVPEVRRQPAERGGRRALEARLRLRRGGDDGVDPAQLGVHFERHVGEVLLAVALGQEAWQRTCAQSEGRGVVCMERAARLGLRAFGVSETCPGVSGSALRQLMMGDWGGEQSSAMEAVETMLYPTVHTAGYTYSHARDLHRVSGGRVCV